MQCFLQFHGLPVVDCRDRHEPITAPIVAGSLMEGFEDDSVIWRRNAADDPLLVASCKQLARNMVKLIHQLNK